jgi:hypothetical protein
MHRSPARRRQAQCLRRHQLRRRRAVALVVFVTLIVAAVWAAYAIPGQTPARVPANAAVPVMRQSPVATDDEVVAQVEGIDVVLPVARAATTAVAFHPVDSADAVALSPRGERVSGGGLGQRLADIFAGGGGLQYYLMAGNGAEASASAAGLDVGAVPGSSVVSPVDGKVLAIKEYAILGRYDDVEVDVQLSSDPSLLLVMTHVAKVQVAMGDVLTGGESVIGRVRGFPAGLDQPLSQYTSDTGDHVQLMVLRITPELAGG